MTNLIIYRNPKYVLRIVVDIQNDYGRPFGHLLFFLDANGLPRSVLLACVHSTFLLNYKTQKVDFCIQNSGLQRLLVRFNSSFCKLRRLNQLGNYNQFESNLNRILIEFLIQI